MEICGKIFFGGDDDVGGSVFVVVGCVEMIVECSGEFGPKKGRKKCIYMYIYIGMYRCGGLCRTHPARPEWRPE